MNYLSKHVLGLMAGSLFVAMSVATAGHAQSQTSGSDTDYLSALDTMVTGMDLDGLAGQTFDPTTVEAPMLPMLAASSPLAGCDTLLAQAEESGRPIEIFGADATLTSEQMAALSKCMMPETGVVVSYLMPEL